MSSSGPVEEGSAKALEKFGFAIPPSPPAVFTGYLWKLSRGFVKTWKYRFFVIQGQCVKYYTDDTLTTVKGSFYFNQQSEVKYGLYRHEGRANILLLHSAHDSGSAHVMYVSSASVEEQKRWYDAFNAAIATSFPSILRTEIWPTKFSPKTALGVVFNGINGTAEMEDGNIVEIDDMAQQPTIYFNAPSAGSSRHYSLLLVSFNDGIKASPKNSSKVSYTSTILWLTCNLPHSSLETIISRYEVSLLSIVFVFHCLIALFCVCLHRYFLINHLMYQIYSLHHMYFVFYLNRSKS